MKYIKYIRIIVTVLILLGIYLSLDSNLIHAFSNIVKIKYIYVSLLIRLVVIPVIVNNRWKVFLKIQGIEEDFFDLVKINFISIFLGFLLPSSTGFDAVRIYLVEKRHKNKLGAGGASVIIERLLGFYLLSLMGVVGSIVTVIKGTGIGVFYLAIAINLFISIVIILLKNRFLYVTLTDTLRKIKYFKKSIHYIDKIYSAINTFPMKKALWVTVVLIFLFQLSCVVCNFLLFKAFDVNISFYYHLAFLPLILILSIIPVSISGFGIREGGFIYFYGLLGVDRSIALLASLLYYAVLVLVPALIGMFLYITNIDYKKAKKELQK